MVLAVNDFDQDQQVIQFVVGQSVQTNLRVPK